MATRDNRSIDDVMETLGEARAPRQTREDTKRVEVWAPASTLPEPDKQPGYAYRWIRVSTNGEKDPRNISAKLREAGATTFAPLFSREEVFGASSSPK